MRRGLKSIHRLKLTQFLRVASQDSPMRRGLKCPHSGGACDTAEGASQDSPMRRGLKYTAEEGWFDLVYLLHRIPR